MLGYEITEGADPQVMMRWSDDGGHTWSSEHWRSMGLIGETQTRVIWRRLGMTNKLRDRVYEVSGTAPVKVAILAERGTVRDHHPHAVIERTTQPDWLEPRLVGVKLVDVPEPARSP